MPTFDIPVREFTTHVLPALAKQYTHKLIADFNLQNVIKDNISFKYGYSAIARTKDKNKNIYTRANRVNVTVDVNMNPDNLKWDIQNFKWNPGYGFPLRRLSMDEELWMDPQVDAYLYLHEVPCNVTLNIEFVLMSRTNAYMLQSAHYETHGTENTWYYGDFMYDFPLNNEILNRLRGIFKLRRFDYSKIDLAEYLKIGSMGRIGYQVNRSGTEKEYVIREHKTQILEDVEIQGDKPQENNDNEGTLTFTVPFTYTIQFSRPAFFTMRYPITIMNTLIPVQHIAHTQELRDNIRNVNFVKTHLDKITLEYWTKVFKGWDHCFVSPFYEDWRPINPYEATNYAQRPVWIITVTLDEENGKVNKQTKISLRGDIIDHYRLHPVVAEILCVQDCESYEPDCLFNVSVFKNDECIDRHDLGWEMDTQSVIINSTDRSKRFHIVISEMTDLNFLNPKWYFLLDRYRDFFKNRVDNDLDNLNNIDDWGLIDGHYLSTRVIYSSLITRREEVQQSEIFRQY